MKVHEYKGGNITVFFVAERCTHVGECIHGLPKVFMEIRQPWIMPDLADADTVAEVVMRCPTGALHFQRTDGGPEEPIPKENIITAVRNGPLYFRGNIEILDGDGEMRLRETRVALCRCGKSKSPPFCDGQHVNARFLDSGIIGQAPAKSADNLSSGKLTVTVKPQGPYILRGPFSLLSHQGEVGFQDKLASLCSCGRSKNTPFCDGSHVKKGLFSRLIKS